MQTIGGYVIVADTLQNAWSAHIVERAFKDKAAAEKHLAQRIAAISEKPFDEYNGEFRPAMHAVSPGLFAKVQKLFSLPAYERATAAFDVGEAITRQRLPSYRVGEMEVFCTKFEIAAPARPVNPVVPRGRAPSPGDAA